LTLSQLQQKRIDQRTSTLILIDASFCHLSPFFADWANANETSRGSSPSLPFSAC
jgi:hypothetical protein